MVIVVLQVNLIASADARLKFNTTGNGIAIENINGHMYMDTEVDVDALILGLEVNLLVICIMME